MPILTFLRQKLTNTDFNNIILKSDTKSNFIVKIKRYEEKNICSCIGAHVKIIGF